MGNFLSSLNRLESPKVEEGPLKEMSLPIIFVLGGPGAGKGELHPVDENPDGDEVLSAYWLPQGTQCERIAKKYEFLHISSGELLREEAGKNTERGEMIDKIMMEGKVVPNEVILELIKEKMLIALPTVKGFVFDGFPREKSQSKCFEKEIRSPDLVIYLKVDERLLKERLQGRAVTSGRKGDTEETIRNKIKHFLRKNHSMLKHYDKKLSIIEANLDIETTFTEVCGVIEKNIVDLEKLKTIE